MCLQYPVRSFFRPTSKWLGYGISSHGFSSSWTLPLSSRTRRSQCRGYDLFACQAFYAHRVQSVSTCSAYSLRNLFDQYHNFTVSYLKQLHRDFVPGLAISIKTNYMLIAIPGTKLSKIHRRDFRIVKLPISHNANCFIDIEKACSFRGYSQLSHPTLISCTRKYD